MSTLGLTHDERVELFLAVLEANHGNVAKTCADIGMSRNVYYKWQAGEGDHYDILRQRIHEVRRGWVDDLLDMAEEKLEQNVAEGIGQDVRFVLTKLGKSRGYGEHLELEVRPGLPGLRYPDEPQDLDEFERLVQAGS